MKNFLFILAILLTGLLVQAQGDSWTVKLNGKTLLVADKADMVKNQKKIKSTEWKKSGNFEIIFTDVNKGSWLRDIYFTDDLENEIWRKDSASSVLIPLSTLRKLSKGKKTLKMYAVMSPSNQRMGMRTRLVHLCTLKLP